MDGNGGTLKMVESTKVETINPEMARQMLAKNSRNRPVNKTAVTQLAKEIREGRWSVTHQGLAFGADGELYDGQHRLHAIIVADRAVKIRVTRGLSPEARDAIDVGGCGTRKAHHIINITDGVNLSSSDRADVVVAHALTTSGTLIRHIGKVLPHELREAVRLHLPACMAVREVIGREHGRLGLSAIIGTFAVAWGVMPETVLEFARHYRKGADLTEGHPALVLRNYILESVNIHGGASVREDLSLRAFSALEAFDHNASRKFLKINKGARTTILKAWHEAHGTESE